MSINKVFITGNLTRSPELRETQSGTAVLKFSVAVNESRKNKQTGEWEQYPHFIDCTMFGNRARGLSQYIHKGGRIAVEGRLNYSSWTDRETSQKRSKLEVIADEVVLMQQAQQQGAQTPQNAPINAAAPQSVQTTYAPQNAQYTPANGAQNVQAQQPAQPPQPQQQQLDLYGDEIPF